MRHQGLPPPPADVRQREAYDENQDALKQLIGAADNSPDSPRA